MATILVVDDTPSEAALMSQVINQLGHTVHTVSDGEACLEAVKQIRPALILLDVVMPKMDGFNTCRKIKKDPETSSVPIVMVTSKSQESDRFWAERQGANGYVVKPFTPDSLSVAIKKFLP